MAANRRPLFRFPASPSLSLNKKGNDTGFRWWKLKSSAGLRWKKRFNLHIWFISVFEGIFLVSTMCTNEGYFCTDEWYFLYIREVVLHKRGKRTD
ncbi:hypothetical protein ACS0TY_023592 [Phlomoides rotata]